MSNRKKSLYFHLFLIIILFLLIPKPAFSAQKAHVTNSVVTPLYPVINHPTISAVGYQKSSDNTITAIDQNGNTIWTINPGPGNLFGGFDFDNDGWPDAAIVKNDLLGNNCGTTPMEKTWIVFIRGKTGNSVSGVAPLEDKCWTFDSSTYPTNQHNINTVLFGGNSTTIAILPYYASTGWFFNFNGSSFNPTTFIFPSIPSFNQTYQKTTAPYVENSHIGNGLIYNINGADRLLLFTSRRVVQYALAPLSSTQLLADNYFKSGNREDTAGRNKGLVAPDPNFPELVVLIAGTSSYIVYRDLLSNSIITDPWGHIERHLTIYNARSNTISSRFFSYAHDNSDGNKYQNRTAYPFNPFIKVAPNTPSRIVYNVFTDGHWYIHVSEPGSTSDSTVIKDEFLWDIADYNLDGEDELFTSPTDTNVNLTYPHYLPRWQTKISRWEESSKSLITLHTHNDVVPSLIPTFRLPNKTDSSGYLYPILSTNANEFVFRNQSGTTQLIQSTASSLLPSPSPKPGDFNSDGIVNLLDFNHLLAKFGNPYTLLDFNAIISHYGN